MEYRIVVWGGTYDNNLTKLEPINTNAMRTGAGAAVKSNIAKLSEEAKINLVKDRRDSAMFLMFF